MGFNNTGNVCIWPSEELLAHVCLTRRDRFRGKTVLELGGGMASLAAFLVALQGRVSAPLMPLSARNAASTYSCCVAPIFSAGPRPSAWW